MNLPINALNLAPKGNFTGFSAYARPQRGRKYGMD
jgi:hypothetical protein